MNKFKDRQEAGRILADLLHAYKNRSNVTVLALPRGGVPVAYEISTALKLPLDVFVVRKLGVPDYPELAMGAVASGGVTVFNQDVLESTHLSKAAIDKVIQKELQELARREQRYRGNRPALDVHNKTVILVDDGIATGATMRAAILALRKLNPIAIVVAIPVAHAATCQELENSVEKIICPLQPQDFYAVGAWYDIFDQTSDEEVTKLLNGN